MIKDRVPENTFEEIKKHLIENSRLSERRWHSVKNEEDSVTGDLLGQLSSEWRNFNKEDEERGKWRINYRKFGSRKNMLEPQTGADGIIQIAIFNSFGKPIFRKGILFQAKKEPILKKRDLLEQIEKMSKFTEEKGNAVFVYGENGYYGMTGKQYQENQLNRNFPEEDSIGNFLAEEFMECRKGAEDLYFVVKKDQLFLPRKEPLIGDLRHKMIIEIKK